MDIFYEKFEYYIKNLDEKKREKYTIRNEMYINILNALQNQNTNFSPKFKFWVRQNFRLVEIGSSEFIYSLKNNLPIIIHEKIYEKINECHIAVGHSGRDKTWAEVIIIFFYANLYSDVI